MSFGQHLNSVNANIQFTKELENTKGQGSPFFDTISIRCSTEIQMNVYRRPTHTDRYIDFHSHHPLCHKRSVVNTLLVRAGKIPSTSKGKREETRRVKGVVQGNNYPLSLWCFHMFRVSLKELAAYENNDRSKFHTSHKINTPAVFFRDQSNRIKPTVY